ncbi:hypothetical protein SAMN04487926_12942 [Paraburkholderia steynii]|uniref:Uncharacterized protein n=1 Tax=Paraburkholderia steynii TaxID=1245441 RepID=A0A7Z7BE95_9BURK|nr:hypothetical protein SAMN04487926_12942 [Paraburkholderia steynii]
MPDSPPIDGQALDFRDDLHHLINIERALTDEPLYGNCNLQQMQTTACRLFRYIEFRACPSCDPVVVAEPPGEIQVKKIVPFIAAAALGVGMATAAQAHVSVGIGIGVPVAPAYPVYAAPPPAYYAPPPPPVVYAPPPVVYAPPVVVGGYYGYHRPYYHHGYYGRPYYRY